MVIDAPPSLTSMLTRRSLVRFVGIAGAVVLLALIAVSGARAQTITDIQSAGPLTDIFIGSDTSCQVAHTGDVDPSGNPLFEFFPASSQDGSCGTSASVGSDTPQLFRPGSWTEGGQSAVSGAGTAQSPLQVTTTVQGLDGNSSPVLTLVEKDSYVVGTEFYSTDMTITNNTSATQPVKLYHAADCFLQGSDEGYGFVDPANGTAACTQNPNNSPPALVEEFAPLTPGSHFFEGHYSQATSSFPTNGTNYDDTCECTVLDDNGVGINWDTTLDPGQSRTFSMVSNFSPSGVTSFPISASGGHTFSGLAGTPVGGAVASFFSSDSTDVPGDFAATINWGDGSSPTAGAISGSAGDFTVSGTHAYGAAGSFPITVTITRVSNTSNTGTATDVANISAPPSPVVTGSPAATGSSGATFSGSANPNGSPTTVHFEYGLDRRYTTPGASGPQYDQSTTEQPLGSDFATHTVSVSVSGLVPSALYHVRLVATNAAGSSNGPDMTFTTPKAAAPAPPALAKSFTGSATGLVLIQVNGKFVPLTQLSKIPNGAVINALHGTLTLNTAAPGATQHAKLAARKGKAKKPKTQSGKFGGAVFKVTQTRSGLATLSLVEGAKFQGAPTYATCKTKKGKAVTAAVSNKTLQLLHGSARGKFRTKGRYSAATIRGTIWTIADRCDGTLVHAIKDTVTVDDLVLHKTITLRPGRSYLAQAHPPKAKPHKKHK